MPIRIQRLAGADPLNFEVIVEEDEGRSRHLVTLDAAYAGHVAPGAKPEAVSAAAFEFRLDREPKEAILSRFDVSLIARYFPEFEAELRQYLIAST